MPKTTFAEAGSGLTITFMPRKGDKIDFDSDRQTEKGPSGGHVVSVDYNAGTCVIAHSDTDGEKFVMDDVHVKRRTRVNGGTPHWTLT